MEEALTIMTTTADKEQAQEIARILVENRLAACVQICGPMESYYFWQGEMKEATEWLCLIKTRKGMWDRVAACLRQHHPYQVPEIIAVPISNCDQDYLQWLKRQVP
ncbi:MAG: divalent-cation tolerance protein CutA [Deltaproteobacteria bacterium]|nr:divalent-cation tolerance protein CutA [Deltaproteobacteria bacterium]